MNDSPHSAPQHYGDGLDISGDVRALQIMADDG